MIDYLLNPLLVDALGWTLIHSLWQGAIFAILSVLILILMRNYTAQSRYIVSVGLFCAFFITLLGTFCLQWQGSNQQNEMAAQPYQNQDVDDSYSLNYPYSNLDKENNLSHNSLLLNNEEDPTFHTSWLTEFRAYFDKHLPLIVTIWFLGILFLQLRLLGQWAFVQRLKNYGTHVFPESWSQKLEQLERKIRISKKVSYLISMKIDSPMVIGWLRPVILMPKQLLSSLSESEIFAVLAHELAHIRREDFIINLMQTFLCNVFFFHPGVWWMSNRIDEEREHCCDDLAVAATGHVTTYAKTLVNVSELQLKMQGSTQLSMAIHGKRKNQGGFSSRIQRLFKGHSGKGSIKEGFTITFVLLTALVLGIAATGSTMNAYNTVVANEIEVKQDLQAFANKVREDKSISPNQVPDLSKLPVAKPEPPVAPVAPEVPVILEDRTSADFSQVRIATNRRPDIHQATFQGLIEKVQRMVEKGADVNSLDDYGRTPLHIASAEGHNIDMHVLIELGAEVDIQDNQGRTPLMYAAADGKKEAVELLLSHQANIDIKDVDGMTAYDWGLSGGIENQNIQQIEQEVQKEVQRKESFHVSPTGVHLKQYDIKKATPALMKVIRHGTIADCAELLINGENVNDTDDTGQTALMVAASSNRIDIAAFLIEKGADVNMSSATGLTALHYAALQNHYEIAQLLIENNAMVDPVMHYSSAGGNENKETIVWEYMNATPLHIAVLLRNKEVIPILISAGADANHRLIRNKYQVKKKNATDSSSNLEMELQGDFLHNGQLVNSDDNWTPYKQALLSNNAGILALFRK